MKESENALIEKNQGHRWEPRHNSPITAVFIFFATIFFMAWIVSLVLFFVLVPTSSTIAFINEWGLIQLFEFVRLLIEPFLSFLAILKTAALPSSLVLLLSGILVEIISRRRIPPATWRVQDELTRALCELGLLDVNHKERWTGIYWVSPIGRWDRKSKRKELIFSLRSTKANSEIFNDIGDRVAGFRGCEDATIEPWRIRGNREGWKLILWYSQDPLTSAINAVRPW